MTEASKYCFVQYVVSDLCAIPDDRSVNRTSIMPEAVAGNSSWENVKNQLNWVEFWWSPWWIDHQNMQWTTINDGIPKNSFKSADSRLVWMPTLSSNKISSWISQRVCTIIWQKEMKAAAAVPLYSPMIDSVSKLAYLDCCLGHEITWGRLFLNVYHTEKPKRC